VQSSINNLGHLLTPSIWLFAFWRNYHITKVLHKVFFAYSKNQLNWMKNFCETLKEISWTWIFLRYFLWWIIEVEFPRWRLKMKNDCENGWFFTFELNLHWTSRNIHKSGLILCDIKGCGY
jgi:hypothetical protein